MVISGEPQFPFGYGFNLNRQEVENQRDFRGEYNRVIVPFQQYQQRIVNTWLPTARDIESPFLGFIYYELPMVYNIPMVSRTFINEGMRAGIPDQGSRERTNTLYLDRDQFISELDIPNEDDIYLFFVNKKGEILWAG